MILKFEIVQQQRCFTLHGLTSPVADNCYGKVGFQLMRELWCTVKQDEIQTTGINHWVYLNDSSMFVGVERLSDCASNSRLMKLEFTMDRYLQHVHVGPYHGLPAKWKALKLAIAGRADLIGSHSLEIYGHHCDDESKLETTILIGLKKNEHGK